MKTKVVYTAKLANYLDGLGFKCLRTELNNKNPQYRVFIFEKTAELEAAVEAYLKNVRK